MENKDFTPRSQELESGDGELWDSKRAGQKIISEVDNFNSESWNGIEVTLDKRAWYREEDLDYFAVEYSIVPKLEIMDEYSREKQNLFFTALAKESGAGITFVDDLMGDGGNLLYNEFSYDKYGKATEYYDFIKYLSNEENYERVPEYKQFLNWYGNELEKKKTTFLEEARVCEQEFQKNLKQRIAEGVLPEEYGEGLEWLQNDGVEYSLCDMIDSQTDYFDEAGVFAATASTIHRKDRRWQVLRPTVQYNLACNDNLKIMQEYLDHEFLHLVGGNYGLFTYGDVSRQVRNQHERDVVTRELGDAESIYEEGVTEIACEILETGKTDINTNSVYSIEKQVLNYLCQESSGTITVEDLLAAHAGRSADRKEQKELIQKIVEAFPWCQDERGAMEMLIERRIWFGWQDRGIKEK